MSKVQSRRCAHRLVPPSFFGLRFKVAQAVRTHSFRGRNQLLITIFHLSAFGLGASRAEGVSSEAAAQTSTRYGLFDLLDHRSAYGFVFGYTIQHRELPLPAVQQLIPVFELNGETELNKGDAGQTSLLGTLGFRAHLKTVGSVQPRLGLGFVFPINGGAREDTHWGVITSLVFEY